MRNLTNDVETQRKSQTGTVSRSSIRQRQLVDAMNCLTCGEIETIPA